MEKIKVIVMDVDGTLLNSEKEISPKTRETLLKAQDLGIRLVLASGRPTKGMMKLAHELDMENHHGVIVSYNGGHVMELSTKETLYSMGLTVDETKRVLHHIKQFNVFPMIDLKDNLLVDDLKAYKLEYESVMNGFEVEYHEDLESFIDFGPHKILTSGEPEYLRQIFNEMADPFKDELNCMFTAPFYVEYTSKGVDKAKALHYVLEHLGFVKDDIIAFGDAQNDLSMLQLARIGVAMANAADEVLEIANYITKSNDEDGIADALEHFIPELAH